MDQNCNPLPDLPTEATQSHDAFQGDIQRERRASYKILIPSGIYTAFCIAIIAYAIIYDSNGALALGTILLSQSSFWKQLYSCLVVKFWLGEEELVVTKKFINEKNARIPYDHIHGMSTTTSFTEKLLGLTSVDIETSSDKSLSNDRLRYIPVEEADEIIKYVNGFQEKRYESQDAILEHEVEHAAESEEKPATSDDFLCKEAQAFDFSDFSSPRVMIYSFLRLRIRKILIAFYGLVLFYQNIDDFLEELGFGSVVNAYGESFSGASPFEIVRLVLLGLMILLSVCFVGIIFIECIRVYGFEVQKLSHSIAIKRGLFTESKSSIDLKRIYGINIHQSIPQRIAGYATLNLYVMGDANKNDSFKDTVFGEVILHPCILVEDIPAFLEIFVPEYADAYSVEPQLYLSPKARGRIMRQTLYKYLLLLAALRGLLWAFEYANADAMTLIVVMTILGMVAITTAIGMVLSLVWELKYTSYTMKNGFLVKKRIRLESTSDYFPRRSLEYAGYTQTIWQIRPRLCDFTSEVVGTSGITINELSFPEAISIIEWVRTGVEAK